ncbi:hypothetical protein LINPERHAP2_LOCUS39519 [Linum perenne]
MRAELKGIVDGMCLACEKGVQKLQIQSDSQAVITLLTKHDTAYTQHATLVNSFKLLCSRD